MELQVTSNAQSMSVSWNGLATGSTFRKHLVDAMRRVGLQLQRTIMQNTSNALLNVRTGRLRRAIFYRVEESADGVVVRAGADLSKAPYGRIHNFGGIIRPVKAKFLTIPVGSNLTPNGVMRVNAREFISNPGSLGFTGSYVNRAKTAIMGTREGVPPEPVFALSKSVTIRPTGYVTGSLEVNHGFTRDQLNGAVQKSLEEVASGSK